MSKKIAINGLGRIGRTVLRQLLERKSSDIEVVAVNNPGNPAEYVHLLKYDSVHGKFPGEVSYDNEGGILTLSETKVRFYQEKDPAEIPWSDTQVDIVIDATGVFKDKAALSRHLHGTVKKVIMCAPGKDLDGTFVVGINSHEYNPNNHHVISNASCTTNCLSPVAKTLHEAFGIENGLMTTVHSYTLDQRLLDSSHSDPRRGRAAALSMIPTTTGAAKAVGLVLPELSGKLDGLAIRVPTPNVSLVDLAVNVSKPVTKETVNEALKTASEGNLKGILRFETEPLVGIDYIGMKESSAVDASLTNVVGQLVKVIAWYDNEAGFSNRVLDLATLVASKL